MSEIEAVRILPLSESSGGPSVSIDGVLAHAMVPGIDLVEVLIRCTRKMPLMLKLLRRFVVEHEDFGDRLERAASEGLQPLAKLSHRLKGATSLLAMHALSDVALRLEVLAEAGAVDQELAVARTALVEEMNRVLGGLRSWLTAQA